LSPEAVAVLAGPRAAEVYALTGGSPLLVTELLAGGGADVPPSIRESVPGRLAAAPPVARPAIEVVALVPGICEWWLVEGAAAGGAHREAAAQLGAALEHAGLLPEPERACLLEQFAVEAHLTDRTHDSLTAIQEAVRLWRALGDRRHAGTSLRQAEVQWRSG